MSTFGFATIISVKEPEGKKHDFCHFSMMLKMVIFVLVQIQKVIFCKKAALWHLLDIPILRTFYSMFRTDS